MLISDEHVRVESARALGQLQEVADGLRKRLPAAAALLEDAAEYILAYEHFPDEAPPTAPQHEPARLGAPQQGAQAALELLMAIA